MKAYRVKNAASGYYLNLHTGTAGTAVPTGCLMSLWNLTATRDQILYHEAAGEYGKLYIGRNSGYVLNRHSGNNNAIARPAGKASDADTLYNTETENGQVRIKLAKRDLYLTAKKNAKGALVYWAPKTSGGLQVWSFEPVDEGALVSPAASEGYVYPTPAKNRRITQGYKNAAHPAYDIAGNGEDLYAVADGMVAFVQSSSHGWKPGQDNKTTNVQGTMASMGKVVVINYLNSDQSRHTGKYMRTVFMHMLNAPNLKPGDKVVKGQKVGAIGNTGRSTGPHLHFMLCVGDNANMVPGKTGWVAVNTLPHIDPGGYFPEYK